MRLNLSLFVFAALSFFASELYSQKNIDWNPNKLGTSQATCAPVNQNSPNPKGPGNDQINNGNGTIATSYTATACGLNYTMAKVRLGKRFFPAGVNQPAAITITGIPVCRQILRAYLYTGGSGNGINFSATVTNPAATASVFPMTQIGNHVDKCWGYTGTYNYRADITALITGNGNYMVSGIPTSITTPGNDMDGASILIIYADPTQNFTGHIVIADGCQVGIGGTQTNTITGFNACAASTMANAFMFITDLQNINPTDVAFNAPANNFIYPAASNDWYDHIVMAAAPAVNAGQTTCRYSVTNNGDCYNIMVEGLYYRTNCNVCSNNLTVTPVVTSTCTAGSATAIVTGGTAPYSYTWTPTALNTSVITNVPTGNYTVTVRDASGCLTGSATVLIPANATTLAVNSGTICTGNSITLSAIGGGTYTWTPSATLSSANGPNVVATPAATTIYTVTGTNSLGCTGTAVSTVVVNPLPVIAVNNPTTCLNSTFTLTANGGTAYAWVGPNGFNSALQNPTFANAQLNQSGNYTVTVTSALGCTNTAVSNVSVVPLPTVTVVGTNTFCSQNFNSSINTTNLTSSGANSYVWTLPAGFSAAPNLNSSPITLTGPVTANQTVATLTVVGTIGACTNSAVYTVTVIPNPTIVPAPATASICQGFSTNLSVSGASTYTWAPGTGLNTTNGPNVIANPNVTTVYSIIGTSVGCNSQTQNVTLNVVPNPTVTVNPPTPAICLGNSINLTASGASTYTWSPNIALNTTVGANVVSTPTVNQTYTVLGSQASCTNIAVVTVSVLGLPSVTVTTSSPTLCMNNFNGSQNTVSLTASGANTYTWMNVVGLTTNTLNGNIVVGTSNGNPVATGSVIGANGTCTNMATFTVNAIPNPVIAVTSASMCAGTSVNLSASGANTYTWSPSTALNIATGPNVIASPSVTTVYSVIGSSVGCNSQTQNAIATVVANPTVVITPPNPVICLGDNINLTASGANNYTWSPNVAISTLNGPNVNVNPTANQTYTIIGEQATCTNVAVVTVTVLPLPVVSVAPSSNTLCMNNFNGSPNTVVLNASGATTYTWGPIVGLTTNTLNGSSIIGTSNGNAIGTGTVIGANGTCTNMATFTVNAIPNPVIAVTSGSMCAGTSVNLSASGANTYTWSPAATLNTANGANVTASPAVTTVYSVIGSSVGCNSQTQNGTANVVANPTPVISPPTPTICFGSSIGLTASGATNYTWSPNISISNLIGSNVTVNPTSTLEYTVIGEQATCTNTAVRTVTVINLPVVNISTSSPTLCMNNFNGSPNTINIIAIGATSYTWLGFNGLNANTTSGPNIIATAIPPSMIGTGTVIGSSSTCTNMATFSVAIIPNPNISIPTATVCFGKSVMLTASGADSYNWSPAGSLSSPNGATVFASPTNTTVYSVIGTSLNCNSTTQTTTVDVVPNPTVLITPGNPTICAGSSIGLAAFGAASYTWFPSASLDNPLASNVIASPNVTTLYTVIGMLNSCTSTAVQQVTVVPLPNLQAIADRTVLCSGDIANINANGASSYTWVPNVNISDANSNFIIASPAATTIYSLIGTNGVCNATLEVPIHVVAKPVLNLIANPSKVCYGSSSNIFATGAQNYSWSPVQTLNMVSPNVAVVSPSVNTNYTITGINSNGTVSCVMTQEILVEVVAPINAAISNSSTICQGETIRLTSGGSNSYQWTPEDGLSNPLISSPYANPTSTTIYTVFISDGGFCKVTATVLVNVNPVPRVDAGPDMIYNIDEPMYLNAKGTGTISWISGDGVLCKDCPYTQIMPNNTGCYKIQAINEFGCKAIDEVCIEVTKNHSIYIPNIFTPNEDGLNETFLVYGVGISEISVTIFDRWGERLYFAEEQTTGWNGYYNDVLCKNDVYVYLVTYKALDGKKYTKTGHVTLLK